MATAESHLRRVLVCATEIIAYEVLNCSSLADLYSIKVEDIHPAMCREAHVQSLLFAGLRSAGYFTLSEALYAVPASAARRIDLAVWLPDSRTWLYLEIEPCGPQAGFQSVLVDAAKLIEDRPADPTDQLRAVFVYGFSGPETRKEGFQRKYGEMGKALEQKGFTRIGIEARELKGAMFEGVQTGLWALGLRGAVS